MATAPSVKIVKQMPYRGGTKQYSNRYHFDNLIPADNTKWTTLCDAIVNAEKLIMPAGVTCSIIGAYGYDAGSDVPVFSKTYSTAGTGAFTTWAASSGDSCALIRYSTAQRSSKNHAIYLYSYMKPVISATGAAGDTLQSQQKTAIETYAGLWVAGFSDGSVTHHRCGPVGHTATGYFVSPYIRHRDFQ